MADTGAPWNIPYIEPTDLVRNYPVANELMADAIAAGLTAAGNPGIGSNVVSVTKLNSFSTTSTSYAAVTGLAATITPTSATSKVLVIAQVAIGVSSADEDAVQFRLSGGDSTDYIGDADGSRERVIAYLRQSSGLLFIALTSIQSTFVFLDSPLTTSPVTYQVEAKRTQGTAFVNRSGEDANNSSFGRNASSITAIEVAV